MKLPNENYVVIIEHDGSPYDQPILLETPLDEGCTKVRALQKAEELRGRFGDVTIARLVFDENDSLIEPLESVKGFGKA